MSSSSGVGGDSGEDVTLSDVPHMHVSVSAASTWAAHSEVMLAGDDGVLPHILIGSGCAG